MLAGAVALHAGIGACLGMWTFALIMLVGCCSFLPGEVVRSLAAALSRPRAARSSAAGPFAAPQFVSARVGTPGTLEPVLASDGAR
jgi:hypothetical protein